MSVRPEDDASCKNSYTLMYVIYYIYICVCVRVCIHMLFFYVCSHVLHPSCAMPPEAMAWIQEHPIFETEVPEATLHGNQSDRT